MCADYLYRFKQEQFHSWKHLTLNIELRTSKLPSTFSHVSASDTDVHRGGDAQSIRNAHRHPGIVPARMLLASTTIFTDASNLTSDCFLPLRQRRDFGRGRNSYAVR